MLSRLVRTQLIIFSVASLIGVTVMLFGYMQLATFLGIGHITVKVELAGTGGLYRFANVTYRGVQIGTVTNVEPTADGATAVLSLQSDPRVPADVAANVRSVSAVGEQYVDLVPRAGGPPYLGNNSIIKRADTTVPRSAGPVLDQLSALVASVPKEKLSDVLDETYAAFNGAGYDFGSLLESGSRIARDADATADRTSILMRDTAPLLDSQARSADSLRTWTHNINGISQSLVDHDKDLRTILTKTPDAAQEVSRLLTQLKPTLPVLLANLTTVGQIGVTYNASLRQLLVLLPPYIGGFSSMSSMNNPTGQSLGSFALMSGDPPACTVGFLPPSSWRSPADTSEIDTPDDLYCKLPQDSPIAVRGVRNNPCMGKPGKRAPTVEICNSDQPYEPLAMRQHVLGPYPFDPNLIAQGVPPDSRVTRDEFTFGPVEGTPLPPPAAPQPPDAAPASFSGTTESGGISAAVTHYDPHTGRYIGSDGRIYQQSDLVSGTATSSWQGLLPH